MPGPKDDRDVRKQMTPPAGVRAQSASEFSFEDETPVDGEPLQRIEQRGRTTGKNVKTAVELIGSVKDELRKEIQAYAETDQRDHAEMKRTLEFQNKTLESQNKTLESQNGKLDEIGGHVSDLRERFGRVEGKLEVMSESFRTGQVRERIEMETTAEVKKQEAETKKEESTFKHRRNLVLWKLIAKIFGASGAVLGAGIAGHYLGKWLGG